MRTADNPLTHAELITGGPDPLYGLGPIVPPPAPGAGEYRYRHLTITPHTPTIGAEVTGVRLAGDLSDVVMDEIRRALLEWKVLFFPGQDIERTAHRAFAERFGELEQHPFFKYVQPGQTDVDVVTLAKDMATSGAENNWHNDVTWHETPSFAAVLRARELPPVGGDTLWADTGAAYDSLPEELRNRLDPLVAEHDWVQTFGKGMTDEQRELLRPAFPPVQHPVVRVIPESGRKVLFVNVLFTTRILGVSPEESDELLRILYRHLNRPEFQVRLRWQPDTIAFWDNRTCQHYASSDYYPARRVMDRISIVGDRPRGVTVTA